MLEDEVNVYRVIQTRRFFSKVINELLPVAKRREMEQISKSIVIDPDSESEPEVSDQDRSGDELVVSKNSEEVCAWDKSQLALNAETHSLHEVAAVTGFIQKEVGYSHSKVVPQSTAANSARPFGSIYSDT